ncbi:LysE family translocator [Pseudoalteromonas luteoviolacea]|uniref:LysE family translocator n=1 Tax=Pseudoalteromonas luteoviolacea TaxID=43657 RepID=UPI001154DE2C|nr:LysE family translocator [Pseudoalteromonas luteoviolacea]TQF66195.1 LysE family translocator [Pseudoalteromonas luteoviolacea]
MEQYFLYITIAFLTIASPGPAVILSVSNSLKYGFKGSISGILGIAIGTLFIAIISGSSLGQLLANTETAFTVIKYIGTAYLIYLGVKMWRTAASFSLQESDMKNSESARFFEAFSLTLLNPKKIFFFISLFPQFVDPSESYMNQFLVLAASFSALVIIIHCVYSIAAKLVRHKLSSPRGQQIFGKASGGFLVCFGLGLAMSNK